MKSAAVATAGCSTGQEDPTRASPLTTLAHVGEPGEVEGREEVLVSCDPAVPAGTPAAPEWGRRGGGGGPGRLTAILQEQEGRTSPGEG